MFHILFTASECSPFIKTGGLADVIGSLPAALQKENHASVSVILPFYDDMSIVHKDTTFVATFHVPVGWRKQTATLYQYTHNGVTYYLIKNGYYFGRNGAYGYFDDGERFVFFSRAIIEALPFLQHTPDVVHSHDWQTGLVPAFLKILNPIPGVKTVFTIHNLQYQGKMPLEMFYDLLNLPKEHVFGLEWDGLFNCMKAGIFHADLLTTVSPAYASEIQSEYFGEGLHPLLQERSGDLYGVINGIDTSAFHPKTDPALKKNYSRSRNDKLMNKRFLQERTELPVDQDIPVIGIVSRLVDQKGLTLVTRMLVEIMKENVQLIILGTGDEAVESMLHQASAHHPHQVAFFNFFDEELARQIYAGSDFFLMPSRFEPCGLGQLIAMRYETVPIVRETGGLRDTVSPYNEYNNEGNGFSFTNFNAHDMFHTLQYALSIYRRPHLWDNLLTNIYTSTYSWDESAKTYISLYQRVTTPKEETREWNDGRKSSARSHQQRVKTVQHVR
ncbi:starch synthase [Alteribacillus persepolensis]|uniref:Glycogen synthase n=1 Tax=Alteribacillus persepolensis TaxID=568899 RepID=A0A1G8DAQ6_9BACI|nr:glycogen synthase [Alteribacillus persepolensis]SDH54755.1 starch synthase [Alteribacillus persepolensis]